MSFRILFLMSLVIAAGCGQNTSSHSHEGTSQSMEENPNQELYDRVMAIHDEVMPKMDDLYTMKTVLSEKLKETANLPEDKRKALEELILQLDEAGKGMMDWMHQFKPDDIVDAEQARAYLEDEMEKVRKVKNDILAVLEKAGEETNKN